MAIFSPLPGSRACLGRGPRQVPGSAVAATAPASVDTDRDNGAALRGTPRSRGCDERASRRLEADRENE